MLVLCPTFAKKPPMRRWPVLKIRWCMKLIDHGFAHNTDAVNLLDKIVTAGLKKAANSTDIILASQGQSILLYLMPEEREKLGKLVGFLQQQPSVALIFTRNGKDGLGSVPGTFSLDLINASHPSRAADVVVSMAWTSKP